MYYVTFLYTMKDMPSTHFPIVTRTTDISLNSLIMIAQKMKEKHPAKIAPFGIVITTEEGEEIKRFFFKSDIIKSTANEHLGILEYIYIRNQCIPYNPKTDKILNTQL